VKDRASRGKLYLLNYADDRLGHKGAVFNKCQLEMNRSAAEHGIKNIVSWSWPELAATDFYKANKEYLDRPYRLNGFVFKPYITKKLLDEIDYGDFILYYDSGDGGHVIDCSLDPLVRLCIENGGTVFHQWGDTNAKWTKRDCFYFMGCDDARYHNAVALQATWFMLQKTEFTVEFVREWLQFTLDERVASYDNRRACGLSDLPGFVENRGDQSVYSNLALKYGLRTFYGAGGQANRRIGNFVRSLSLGGWLRVRALRQAKEARALLGRAKRITLRFAKFVVGAFGAR
jgi:hypothetical protein